MFFKPNGKIYEDNINHIKECVNKNYYVIYRERIDNNNRVFRYKLICNEEKAEDEYNNIKNEHNVVALYHDGKFLKNNLMETSKY